MSEIFERFPEMQPVNKLPSLYRVNGIGTTAFGRRDIDAETGTYVTTVWLTVVFIPVLPLSAYRVADAPNGGWYFIGKVGVSAGAKVWSLGLFLAIAGTIGLFTWKHHIGTPSYQAGLKLAEADGLRQEGRLADAAQLYREVADGGTNQAPKAMRAIADLLDSPDLQENENPAEVAAVFRVAWDLRERPGGINDLFERGLRFAEARSTKNPEASLAVLEAVEPAAPQPQAALPLKQKLLERLTRDQPRNVELLSKLAVVYERSNQRERCQPLLEPHAGRLGATEGARVLGVLYFESGKHTEAFTLLQPYADQRLKDLNDAERQYRTAIENAQDQVISQLKGGSAPGFDYARYKAVAQATQDEMVNRYLSDQLAKNQDLKRQREELVQQAAVVPVAIDLGIMRLGRAQAMANPAERKAELEQAERTFLAVRGLAGDQAEYRLSLGQVYYWLGKQAEGRKLFDEVLQADGRKFESLLGIASLLRELGAVGESRTLSEEAYNQPDAVTAKRQKAAMLRALTNTDLDDEIAWLERADPAQFHVKAALAESRGNKAMREGRDADAAASYREAVAIYAAQPETSATLNNGGLACLALYQASGERETLDKGVRMLEKAIARKPGDGILMGNVAELILRSGLTELLSERIDFRKLRRQAELSDLAYVYDHDEERQALIRRIKDSAGIARARSHFDRALILAPNNRRLYSDYQELLDFLEDREGLANLERRAAESKPDLSTAQQEMRDFWEGKKDDKWRRDISAAVGRAERTVADVKAAGGATFAVAAASLVRARLAQEPLDMPFDVDALVRLAEEAHQAAPSAGTRSTLQAALLSRASRALAAQEPEYASLVARARRTLGSSHLIAVVLWREGSLRERALANQDVRRVLELLCAEAARGPSSPDEWTWVMLRGTHPEQASRITEALKTNELVRLSRILDTRLSPSNASMALRQCWALHAAGKAAEAKEVLKKCAADGVPLPFEAP